MKRKYPQDNDTIAVIKSWLTQNKVEYKWKSKRKPELVEIMHVAISAVKKRAKNYTNLSQDDLPLIKITRNAKGKLHAQLQVSSTDSAENKKHDNTDSNPWFNGQYDDVDFKKEVNQAGNPDTMQVGKETDLIKNALNYVQHDKSVTAQQNKSQTNVKHTTADTQKNIHQTSFYCNLKPNEWLLCLILPTIFAGKTNLVFDTTTGEIYDLTDIPSTSHKTETTKQETNNNVVVNTASQQNHDNTTNKLANTPQSDLPEQAHISNSKHNSNPKNQTNTFKSVITETEYQTNANKITTYPMQTDVSNNKDKLIKHESNDQSVTKSTEKKGKTEHFSSKYLGWIEVGIVLVALLAVYFIQQILS